MNSLELAYQMKSLAMDSRQSVPRQPETLSGNMPASSALNFQMDSSRFDMMSSSALSSFESPCNQSQLYSSMVKGKGMSHGWGSTLSRSRCVSNLSCLGSVSSEGSGELPHSRLYYTSLDNGDSWGYYVDSVSD
ncbi:hypothetical protein ACHAXS_000820 [Conticribra weissflogii]